MFEDPQKYLDQHLEPPRDKRPETDYLVVSELSEAEQQAWQEENRSYTELYPEAGEFHFEGSGVEVNATFASVRGENLPGAVKVRIYGSSPDDYNNNNRGWRVVTSLTLRETGSDKQLDVTSLLPEGSLFLFSPYGQGGSSFPRLKAIFFSGDLRSPDAFITGLHEIGHLYSHQIMGDTGGSHTKVQTGQPINSREGEEVLRDERNAAAFSAKHLRPFIKEDGWLTREKLNASLHGEYSDEMLTFYSDSIRKGLDQETN